jgi:hypothetical protein
VAVAGWVAAAGEPVGDEAWQSVGEIVEAGLRLHGRWRSGKLAGS